MIVIECQQGTEEWLNARAGATTASCVRDALSTVGGLTEQQKKYVDAVLAGASEKEAASVAGYRAIPKAANIERALCGEKVEEPSGVALRYASDLAIERISGKPYGEPPKSWILERGHEMEERARRTYEARSGYMVSESGLVLTDDRKFGYSSDGMAEDEGLIEIKAPIDSQKILAMWQTGDVSEYVHQMQTGMWITGRKWCDLIMYVPDLEPVGKDLFVKRVHRDDDFIDDMIAGLLNFDRLVDSYVLQFRTTITLEKAA